ncbi:MAG TPA: hypothetical protein VGL63_07405 [Streptosporangiaceae bacterium]|jgi:hypothetical protein
MEHGPVSLRVKVAAGPGADTQEVADATLRLRRELLNLDVVDVATLRAGEAPPGSRAVDMLAVGTLVVNLAEAQILPTVVATVRSWLAGSSWRRVRLELGGDVLDLTGVSSREQRRLADEWLARHAVR